MPKPAGTRVGGFPSRSRVLTNADLERGEPTTITNTTYKTPEELQQEGRAPTYLSELGIDPVAEARQYLASLAGKFQPDASDEAETDRRMAENIARREEMLARPGATRPLSLGDVSGAAESFGRGAQTAGLIPSPASPYLLAGGTALRSLGRLGQGIENPEEGMGLGEGAMEATAAALPGMQSAREAVSMARSARIPRPSAASLRQTMGVRQGTQVPSMGAGKVNPVNPGAGNYRANLQRGKNFEDVAEQVTQRGAGAADPANLDRTRTFGDLRERIGAPANLDRTRTFGDLMERIKPASSVPPGSWMGDVAARGRTVPPTRPELTQAMGPTEDAWSALRQLATRSEGQPAPGSALHRSVGDFAEAGLEPASELSSLLNASMGAARARERAQRLREFGEAMRQGRTYRPEF